MKLTAFLAVLGLSSALMITHATAQCEVICTEEFLLMDVDQNSSLSEAEFHSGFLGPAPPEELTSWFEIADTDDSGTVSMTEWLAICYLIYQCVEL